MTIRLAFVTVFFLVLAACSRSTVSERIYERVRDTGEVNLAEAANFNWDTVYIFGPYHVRKGMCEALPKSWSDCQTKLPPALVNPESVLIFELAGQVVHHELHLRANGDFCSTKSSCPLKLPREKVKFQALAVGAGENGRKHYSLQIVAP